MRDHEKEFLRAARVHRFRRGSWKDFWATHRAEIYLEFPDARERADLVDRLQEIILLGTSGRPAKEELLI